MTLINVSQYLDLIDACFQSRLAFLASVGDQEQRLSVMSMDRAVAELKSVSCRRTSERDSRRAKFAIETCELLITQKRQEFNRSDALIAHMAFAGEWR